MEYYIALIGIDGGSWRVFEWLFQENYMPNLRQLVSSAVCGSLRSLVPPVTGGVWLSLATGLNPGKTGVIDFVKHVGNWVLKPVSAEDYRDRALWDYCSACGLKVAVLDYPMLYPAYPVNGIMISSWGEKVTTYPPELINEIRSIVGGDYDIFVNYHLEKYNDIELFLEDLTKAVNRKLKVSRHFMKQKWNLFIDVISYTDWLQHRMWHYIDPNHPWYPGDREASKYKKRFAEFWQLLDEYIGEVTNNYDIVFIVSDHGFGPQWGVFNLARWIIEHGYAYIRRNLKKKILKLLSRIITKLGLYKILPRRFHREAREHSISLTAPPIVFDTKRSKVIVLNYTIPFGAIHVNPRYSCNANEIIYEFIYRLSGSVRKIKNNLEVKVWLLKELYRGDKLHYLPDVVFTINDWSCVVIKDPNKEFIYLDEPYSPRHTGSHRLYGIFVAYGEGISKGKCLVEASILDIAPTILHILDLPIPDNTDGHVLAEIFEPHSMFVKREPRYVSPTYYMKLKLTTKIRQIRETKLVYR